jgi:hypothetical protein
MRAALYWLLTGKVTFATLRSKQSALNDDEKAQALLPVSPKSMYALAHYLGCTALCDLALSEYERQLETSTIDAEVTCDLFMAHSAVRKMVLKVRTLSAPDVCAHVIYSGSARTTPTKLAKCDDTAGRRQRWKSQART